MYTNFLRSLTAVNFSHVFASSLILIFVALYQAEYYAALPFVHLLLESNFLPISRLATLFMHGLNTVFLFAALVMLFCAFALPFWVCNHFWPPPFLGGVSNALGISDYARFFMELGFFLYCYCCLIYRILSLSFFNFFCGYVGPVRLDISWTASPKC